MCFSVFICPLSLEGRGKGEGEIQTVPLTLILSHVGERKYIQLNN
jgi:hypothetical protein